MSGCRYMRLRGLQKCGTKALLMGSGFGGWKGKTEVVAWIIGMLEESLRYFPNSWHFHWTTIDKVSSWIQRSWLSIWISWTFWIFAQFLMFNSEQRLFTCDPSSARQPYSKSPTAPSRARVQAFNRFVHVQLIMERLSAPIRSITLCSEGFFVEILIWYEEMRSEGDLLGKGIKAAFKAASIPRRLDNAFEEFFSRHFSHSCIIQSNDKCGG